MAGVLRVKCSEFVRRSRLNDFAGGLQLAVCSSLREQRLMGKGALLRAAGGEGAGGGALPALVFG